MRKTRPRHRSHQDQKLPRLNNKPDISMRLFLLRGTDHIYPGILVQYIIGKPELTACG